mgnify:CR=1 FL=1
MGCGRPVISTSFLHANDIVTENRGKLVEFQNPASIKDAVLELLSDKQKRKEMDLKYQMKSRWKLHVVISKRLKK